MQIRIFSWFTRLSAAVLVAAALTAGCGGDGITDPNDPPSASISSPSDGASLSAGQSITFQGSADDPEDGALTGSSLEWSSDVDGVLGSGESVTTSSLSTGSHTVTLTATDGDGATAEASVSITVEANDPPSASISSPSDGATFSQWEPFTLQGSGDDPEDGALTGGSLVWESDVDGQIGTGETATVSTLSADGHTITLTATDSRGATDQATVSVTVEPNGQPSVSISSPSDGASFSEGDAITFQGSASDPEDGSLTGSSLVWSSDVDGQIGTGESVTTSSLTADSHTVTLAATDSDGGVAETSVSIDVEGAPSVSITSPSDESAFDEGQTVTLEGSATDPVDGPLTGSSLEWSSDVDGVLGTGESLSVSSLSAGPQALTLTATDSDGNSASASVDLVVEAPGFDIRLRFVDSFTSAERSTVRSAMDPWKAVITGDLSAYFPTSSDASSCLTGEAGIDDLLVAVRVRDLDGPGGALAQAGPCLARTDGSGNFTLPISGVVTIDQADRGNSELERIVTHEVGHALGIGISALNGWGPNTAGLNSRDPFFSGSNTVSAFRDDLDGQAYLGRDVPLANTGGMGTAGAHWREFNFNTELMTGFIDSGVDMPLSVVTVGSLADLGYTVDMSAADPYTLPMPQTALWLAEADATLSHPASSGENFGGPGDGALGSSVVVGSNNANLWSSSVPESEVYSGLLRFQVPSSLPSGVTLESAILTLVVEDRNAETTSHDIEVVQVTEAWSEDMVTWDGRPSVAGSPLFSISFDACSTGCSVSSTALENLATDWLDGSAANHGLLLRAPDAESDPTFSVGFWSRHASDAGNRPLMRIDASTGSPVRGLRAAGSGREIPLGDDIRRGPLYGVGPDGRVLRVVEIQ